MAGETKKMEDMGSKSTLGDDWSPDQFPTSAKPIFKRTALLVGAIALLCSVTYFISDNSDVEQPKPEEIANKSGVDGTSFSEEDEE